MLQPTRKTILIVTLIVGPLAAFAIIRGERRGDEIPNPTLPNPNARDTWIAADNAIIDSPDDFLHDRRYFQGIGKPLPTPADRAVSIASNSKALQLIRKGLTQPYMNVPVRSDEQLMPEFSGFRELARVLAVESMTYADRKEWAKAAGSGLDAMEMGNRIPKGGVLIARLVGDACEAIGRRYVGNTVDNLSPAESKMVITRLVALDTARMPFSETIQEEAWSHISSLQKALSAPEASPIAILKNMQRNPPHTLEEWQVMARFLFDKGGIIHSTAAFWKKRKAYVSQPFIHRGPEPVLKDNITPVFPVLEQGWLKDLSGQMQNRLLILRLALHAYRAERGDYPSSLMELVHTGYLSVLPEDPFAAATTFRYRRLSGSRYLLYSIGPDGKDDGGKPAMNTYRNIPVTSFSSMSDVSKGDFVVGVNDTVVR